MKKTLVAIAAIAASTGAFAQSSVSLYGVLDYGYSQITNRTNGAVDGKKQAFAFSSNDSSRWGLTGTEDMGNGLKASFRVEQGIGTNPRSGFEANEANISGTNSGNATTLDNTVIGDRELWAAIEMGNTTVKLGYGGTALRSLALATDAASTNGVGNPIAHEAGTNRRAGVTVTQKLGAFTASAQVSRNKDSNLSAGSTADKVAQKDTGYNYGLTYAQGPLTLGVAQDKVTNIGAEFAAAADINAGSSVYATPIKASAADSVTTTTVAGGTYDFGKVKAFAQYYTVNVDNKLSVNAAGEGKKKAYSLGLQAPMGAVTLLGQVVRGTNSQAAVATNAGEDRAWTGYTLGARYALSKRTYAYGYTGQYKTAAGSVTATFGDESKRNQTSVGVVHSF
ncbi:porin [Limnohabitans sp. INBF002]|nr:porin [Limnohabitans sp. INBF002]